jgi:hypothetical protein
VLDVNFDDDDGRNPSKENASNRSIVLASWECLITRSDEKEGDASSQGGDDVIILKRKKSLGISLLRGYLSSILMISSFIQVYNSVSHLTT